MKLVQKISDKIRLAGLLAFIASVYACMCLQAQTEQKQAHVQAPVKEHVIEMVMNYPMPDPIARCKKDFGYSDSEMKLLEKELKRYLILCILKSPGQEGVGMYSKDVDNLWHSFILFTREYAEFGKKCAGYFLHHMPRTDHDELLTRKESHEKFLFFTNRYKEIFGEAPHAIWFLDMYENNKETKKDKK